MKIPEESNEIRRDNYSLTLALKKTTVTETTLVFMAKELNFIEVSVRSTIETLSTEPLLARRLVGQY